jgi:rubrerythrin
MPYSRMSHGQLDAIRSEHVREGAAQLSAISLAEWMNLNGELGLSPDRYAEEAVAPHLLPRAGRERNSLAHRRYKLAQFLEWLGQQAMRGIIRRSVLIAWCATCGTPADAACGRCPDCGAVFPIEH